MLWFPSATFFPCNWHRGQLLLVSNLQPLHFYLPFLVSTCSGSPSVPFPLVCSLQPSQRLPDSSCFLLLNWVIQRMCRLLLGLDMAKTKASSCWHVASSEWPEKALWGWRSKNLSQPLYLNIQIHCLLCQHKKVKELGNFHIRRKPAGQAGSSSQG